MEEVEKLHFKRRYFVKESEIGASPDLMIHLSNSKGKEFFNIAFYGQFLKLNDVYYELDNTDLYTLWGIANLIGKVTS